MSWLLHCMLCGKRVAAKAGRCLLCVVAYPSGRAEVLPGRRQVHLKRHRSHQLRPIVSCVWSRKTVCTVSSLLCSSGLIIQRLMMRPCRALQLQLLEVAATLMRRSGVGGGIRKRKSVGHASVSAMKSMPVATPIKVEAATKLAQAG